MRTRLLISLTCFALVVHAAGAHAQTRPKIGETITTASGLRYKFTKIGNGAAAQPGQMMIMHGVGTLANGREFWSTRTTNQPFEFLLGIDTVIKGFAELMPLLRVGDRVIATMPPNLGYGNRGTDGIPPNSTLVFDYEILAIKRLSIAKVLSDGMAAGSVDAAITKAKALPNRAAYYATPSSLWSVAARAERKRPGDGEKIYAYGTTLFPKSYEMHQALAGAQTERGAVAAAIKSFETALRLNPKKTLGDKTEADRATSALQQLRKR